MVTKANQIVELRSTVSRLKILDILNYLKEIFNGLTTEGQGLNILTPNQMLSRLPITLARLNARNNSEKLKKGITQLLYSLYRSKNLQSNSVKV